MFVRVELREIPTGRVRVDAIHECRVVAHLRRQWAQQVSDALLVLDFDIEVADHHDATLGTDAFLAAREFTGLHVALEDVHAVFLIKRHTGDFVEADDVVLTHQTTLAIGVVDEHLRHRGLTAGDQMCVWGDLLVKVALARPAWTQLDHVVVALHERHHPDERDQLCTLRQRGRLQAHATQQNAFPFLSREVVAAALERIQHICLGKLDGSQTVNRERTPALLLSDGSVVAQRDFGVEAIGEHSLMLFDEAVVDTDILDGEARQLRDERVRLCVKLCSNDIDQLD